MDYRVVDYDEPLATPAYVLAEKQTRKKNLTWWIGKIHFYTEHT